MAFAEMRSRLQDLVRRYGLLETLNGDHFYPTLSAAIEAIDPRSRERLLWSCRRWSLSW